MKWIIKDNYIYVSYLDRYFKSKDAYEISDETGIQSIDIINDIPEMSKHGYFKIEFFMPYNIPTRKKIAQWFQKIEKKDFVKAVI